MQIREKKRSKIASGGWTEMFSLITYCVSSPAAKQWMKTRQQWCFPPLSMGSIKEELKSWLMWVRKDREILAVVERNKISTVQKVRGSQWLHSMCEKTSQREGWL
jgi:hypothetical protein